MITVEDEGPGIPPDERVLVFDRLYRGRAARDAHPGGTGTGLHVCRRLVEAHGGRIWIEPDAGRSAISFSVPVARRAHVSAGEPGEPRLAVPLDATARDPRTVAGSCRRPCPSRSCRAMASSC